MIEGLFNLVRIVSAYFATCSSRSRTRPCRRSSLYPVIGSGFAPDVALFAAAAIVAGVAAAPSSAASSPFRRNGTGAMPPAAMRMNVNLPSAMTARTQSSTSGHSACVRLIARL